MQWAFTEAHADDIQEHYQGVKKLSRISVSHIQSRTQTALCSVSVSWLGLVVGPLHSKRRIGEVTDVFVSPLPQLALTYDDTWPAAAAAGAALSKWCLFWFYPPVLLPPSSSCSCCCNGGDAFVYQHSDEALADAMASWWVGVGHRTIEHL